MVMVIRKRAVKKPREAIASGSSEIKIVIVLAIIVIIVAIVGICIYISTMSEGSSDNTVEGSWGDAPDFTLETIDGGTFTLSDNFGKVIVIDLMAAWCYWCKPQMAELEAVLEDKGNEIVIVSVDVDKGETGDDVRNTFGDYVEKWTFVLDNYEQDVSGKYQVTGIPKIVIIDKEGNIYYSQSGLTSKAKLIEEINKAGG